jgi:hypothetical protein
MKPKRKILYHGSNASFDEFSTDYLSMKDSIDQYGSGFYFFDKKSKTPLYGEICYTVEAEIQKILYTHKKFYLYYDDVEFLLLAAPDLDDRLNNFGDVDYYGFDKVLADAIHAYAGQDAITILNTIGNDFYSPEDTHLLLKKFIEITGYDCVVNKERGIWVILSKQQLTIKRVSYGSSCNREYHKNAGNRQSPRTP